MKILEQKEKHIMKKIRDSIALNPLISIRKLQDAVEEKTGRSISDKYLTKLVHKIRIRAVIESDRKKLNESLAQVRERYRVLSENLLRTIYWNYESLELCGISKPKEKERQSAIRLLAQMDLALLKTELEVGAFQKQELGGSQTEIREQIIGVSRSWNVGHITQKSIEK